MITENLSTLQIHKLTKEQYEKTLQDGNIIPNALYLTPDDENPNLDLPIAKGAGESSLIENDLNLNRAKGKYAHAEGSDTTAIGENSHTEGKSTLAIGSNSHVEGEGNKNKKLIIATGGKLKSGSTELIYNVLGKITTDEVAVGSLVELQEDPSKFAFITAIQKQQIKLSSTLGQLTTETPINVYTNCSIAKGAGSHAEGIETKALRDGAHAEGCRTRAYGNNSHAEGDNTTAFDNYSHAEGMGSGAIGIASHAEGVDSNAEGYASHAEGDLSYAKGYTSHAEGDLSCAYGDGSHAEGRATSAMGENSHTEGHHTTALGQAAHAEGYSSTGFGYSNEEDFEYDNNEIISEWETSKFSLAKGIGSHVEGMDNLALYNHSHAEGFCTIASGDSSHAEGKSSIASGDYSHAESTSRALADYAHAEGLTGYNLDSHDLRLKGSTTNTYQYVGDGILFASCGDKIVNGSITTIITDTNTGDKTITTEVSLDIPAGTEKVVTYYVDNGGSANGKMSHIEGLHTYTGPSAAAAHAEGSRTMATDTAAHAEGGGTIASGSRSHAEGSHTEASGYAAHAEGSHTEASGSQSHTEGYYTKASGWTSHSEGMSTIAANQASHAEGNGTAALGKYAHAEGYYFESAPSNIATLSKDEILKQWNKDSKSFNAAYGLASHTEGGGNLAIGDYTHAEGRRNKATGESSHVEGFRTEASGSNSHAEGAYTYATGIASHAEGSGEKVTIDLSTITSKEDVLQAWNSYKDSFDYQSFAMAYGSASHVEGYGNLATGAYSHAEGDSNLATGLGAHAEGCVSIAAGKYSHAEGTSGYAIGNNSHAEGTHTQAIGDSSHTEGVFTGVTGYCSHAGGLGNWVSGNCSYAFGGSHIHENHYTSINITQIDNNEYTINSYYAEAPQIIPYCHVAYIPGFSNFVDIFNIDLDNKKIVLNTDEPLENQDIFLFNQNECNIIERDSCYAMGTGIRANDGIKNAFITGQYNLNNWDDMMQVGGGLSFEDRRNLFALSDDGSARFTGDIYVNCEGTESKDTVGVLSPNKKLATVEYVDNVVSGAAPGTEFMPKSGGAFSGGITTKGINLTSKTDYGTSMPEGATNGRLFFMQDTTNPIISEEDITPNNKNYTWHIRRYRNGYAECWASISVDIAKTDWKKSSSSLLSLSLYQTSDKDIRFVYPCEFKGRPFENVSLSMQVYKENVQKYEGTFQPVFQMCAENGSRTETASYRLATYTQLDPLRFIFTFHVYGELK